jgi:hypothetical protein
MLAACSPEAETAAPEARPVRTEPLDAARVVIVAGVTDGDRIVVGSIEPNADYTSDDDLSHTLSSLIGAPSHPRHEPQWQ